MRTLTIICLFLFALERVAILLKYPRANVLDSLGWFLLTALAVTALLGQLFWA